METIHLLQTCLLLQQGSTPGIGGWILSVSVGKGPCGSTGLCPGSCASFPGSNLNFGQNQAPVPLGIISLAAPMEHPASVPAGSHKCSAAFCASGHLCPHTAAGLHVLGCSPQLLPAVRNRSCPSPLQGYQDVCRGRAPLPAALSCSLEMPWAQVVLLLGHDTPEPVSGETLVCGIRCSFKSRLKLYFVFPYKE